MPPTFRVRTTGRWLCHGLLHVLIGVSMTFAASAATPDWGAIAEWQGVIEYTETGSIDDDRNGMARVFSRSVDEHTVAHFTLKRRESSIAADGIFTWTGRGTATINSLSRQNERNLDGSVRHEANPVKW